MSDSREQALEVLREVWRADETSADQLDETFGSTRSCKTMKHVGFDALAEGTGDLQEAWRATLRREGKLSGEAGSLRDLVLGPDTDA
jgi:hypothetical protein